MISRITTLIICLICQIFLITISAHADPVKLSFIFYSNDVGVTINAEIEGNSDGSSSVGDAPSTSTAVSVSANGSIIDDNQQLISFEASREASGNVGSGATISCNNLQLSSALGFSTSFGYTPAVWPEFASQLQPGFSGGWLFTNTYFDLFIEISSEVPAGTPITFQKVIQEFGDFPSANWSLMGLPEVAFAGDILSINFHHEAYASSLESDLGKNIMIDITAQSDINPVPIPGTLILLGPGLIGIVGIRRRFLS
ncbi:MAG: PEP-CTERM sorting domain-containing protein [Deltaproteobacteria bacterium]|nr:PEP-CTERM sorting domain-containing protein [Deltaproteobacteria bacterium]